MGRQRNKYRLNTLTSQTQNAQTPQPAIDDTQIGIDFSRPSEVHHRAPELKRIPVGEAPDIATTPSTQETVNEPENRNIAHIRTVKGTNIEVRYRAVEVNDLITSTNDNGSPNPAYPQELQPRQRDRMASFRQVTTIACTLDPELVAESKLASDGAPIVWA